MILNGIYSLLLIVIILNQGGLQIVNEEDSICWEKGIKLAWKDFQGEPDTLTTNIGTPALAGTAASIRYRLTERETISVKVSVEFLKNSSWSKDTTSLLCLMHEQLHFDIAELYARKIRKKVQELNDQEIHDMELFNKEVKDLLQERNKMNQQYDKETGHGVVDFVQERWNKKIVEELKGLEEYSSTKEDCKCFEAQEN
jgi:hypothetical protein